MQGLQRESRPGATRRGGLALADQGASRLLDRAAPLRLRGTLCGVGCTAETRSRLRRGAAAAPGADSRGGSVCRACAGCARGEEGGEDAPEQGGRGQDPARPQAQDAGVRASKALLRTPLPWPSALLRARAGPGALRAPAPAHCSRVLCLRCARDAPSAAAAAQQRASYAAATAVLLRRLLVRRARSMKVFGRDDMEKMRREMGDKAPKGGAGAADEL